MNALGIVRKIDELGRVVIPKEVRDSQGWKPGQPMEMFMDGDKLSLQAYGKAGEKMVVLQELKVALELIDNPNLKQAIQTAMNYIEG